MDPKKKEPSYWDNLKNAFEPVDETYHSPGAERSLARAFGFSKPKKQQTQQETFPDFKKGQLK